MMDGRLYVCDLGLDCVFCYELEKADIVSCGGKGPRDFEVFGKWIVAANQYSHQLTVMEYSEADGSIRVTSVSENVSSPVMIEKR